MNNFAAIDFETANERRDSACAVGLAWIEGGRVVRRESRLIRPPQLRFSPGNIRVHGILPADVRDAPTFPEVIAEFLPDLSGGLMLAHNAGFDMGVITAACMGQMKLPKVQAKRAAELFGLTAAEERMLNEAPYRGSIPSMPPTDPLIYRLYELVMVNGPAWKALIEEEFGDGIMSAIDFDMDMERLANPKGDRVKITMSGKFLPYKYYGATGNQQEYGFKEA